MTRTEIVAVCRTCKNHKFSKQGGYICGLNNEQADFQTTCPSYTANRERIDKEEEQRNLNSVHIKQAKKGRKTLIVLFLICFAPLILPALMFVPALFSIDFSEIGTLLLFFLGITAFIGIPVYFVLFKQAQAWKYLYSIYLGIYTLVYLVKAIDMFIEFSFIYGLSYLCVSAFFGLIFYFLYFDINVKSFFKYGWAFGSADVYFTGNELLKIKN